MIQLVEVTKTFGTGSSGIENVSLSIDRGEFVFLVGPSGSGKTTLLRLLIRDMVPTKGLISVNNVNIGNLPSDKIPHLRKQIGVVFQDLKMLTDRTIFENILLPLEMAGISDNEAKKKAEDIMSQVGILDHAHKFPVQLSGGELQRAAIARALVFSPDILLADEPTGNLDNTTSWEIIKILQDINKAGTTVLMATHNMDVVVSLNKRTVTLEKGKIAQDTKKPVKSEKEEKEGKEHSEKKHHEEKKEPEGEEDVKKEDESK